MMNPKSVNKEQPSTYFASSQTVIIVIPFLLADWDKIVIYFLLPQSIEYGQGSLL